MRWSSSAAAVAAVSLFASGIGSAQTAVEHVTLQQWGQRVGNELNRHLRYPNLIGGQAFATGVVRVKFNCSESGRPDKVTLLKSSGSPALDRAALRAVGRIATLHPLPDGIHHDQRYQAVVLFETDMDAYEQRVKAIRAEAVKTNAWFKDTSQTAAADVPILIAG